MVLEKLPYKIISH